MPAERKKNKMANHDVISLKKNIPYSPATKRATCE